MTAATDCLFGPSTDSILELRKLSAQTVEQFGFLPGYGIKNNKTLVGFLIAVLTAR